MNRVHVQKTGLALGALFGLIHLVWIVMVATGVAAAFLNWILRLHLMTLQYSILPFSWGSAIGLLIVTSVIGYLVGVVFAWLWNRFHSQS